MATRILPNFCFPRSSRLLKPAEFQWVFEKEPTAISRGCFDGDFWVLRWCIQHQSPENQQSSGGRLGIIVAKKLLTRSVDRTKVKRIAREAFRLNEIRNFRADLVLQLRCKPSQTPLSQEDVKLLRSEATALLSRLVKRF